MKTLPLQRILDRVAFGAPLRFGVRSTDGELLLARGQAIVDDRQLQALFERGACVREVELLDGIRPVQTLAELANTWRAVSERLSQALQAAGTPAFEELLTSVAISMDRLLDKSPDLAMFLVVRRESSEHVRTSVMRALHDGIAAGLLARRLNWRGDLALTLVLAALTMNLSMLGMLDRLSNQSKALSQRQRDLVDSHGARSRELLEASGITDVLWLNAVEGHALARGYFPSLAPGEPEPAEGVARQGRSMAQALHTIEIYGAKLNGREGRPPLTSDAAARQLMKTDLYNPFALSLVQALGPYPPGSVVHLRNGELAVVTRRGARPAQPQLMVMTNRSEDPLGTPFVVDAPSGERSIVSAVGEERLRARVAPENIYAKALIA